MPPPLLSHSLPVAAAQAHLRDCRLCPHLCGPARATATGHCRVGQASFIASEMLHWGEEELLRPAHAVFFSGCTATCTFCTAARFAFRPQYGVNVAGDVLAQRVLQRQAQGARSLCFIGGDPVPHIPFILETLDCLGSARQIPAVFNSNLYVTDEALALLAPAIDVYLPDLKFGPGACGEKIGGMPDYWAVLTGNIGRLLREGKRVIVRHLLMPGHFDCCTRPCLAWLAQWPSLEISLLRQYVAPPQAQGELAQTLSSDEIAAARSLAQALRLKLLA